MKMFPLLAFAVPATSALVWFIVVAIIAALLLTGLPGILGGDAGVWKLIRLVVIIALLLYALSVFGVI